MNPATPSRVARHATALLTACWLALNAAAADLSFPFVDELDASAAARWHAFAGEWTFDDGGAHQSSASYDCGAAIAVTPDGPFVVAVNFTPESGFNGGGLFFALPQLDRKNGGMMVRCDPGGRVLYGWFDGAGTFEYHGDLTVADTAEAQELAVAVDPANLAFNVFHNGKKVGTNIKTDHALGYVGIQTSGGPHTFTRFEVRAATEKELAGIEPPGEYGRIVDIIGDEHGILALRRLPAFLMRFDEQGEPRASVVVGDLPGVVGDALEPIALSWDRPDAEGRGAGVYVLAGGGQRVYQLSRELRVVGNGPLIDVEQMRGRGIAADSEGRIFIADDAIPGIRVFAADGRELLKYGEKGGGLSYDRPNPETAGRFQQPRGIAVSPDGLIVVADRENLTYVCYRYDASANKLNWVTNGPWLPHPEGIRFDRKGRILLAGQYEYYRSNGALRILTIDGMSQNVFIGHALRDMSERVRACEGAGGKLFIADADKGRVVVLPPDFVEKMPEFEWLPDGGVKLTMTKVDGSRVSTLNQTRLPDDEGRIVVRQREPVCETWPPAKPNELVSYFVPPAPPAGQKYIIDMPVLVAVFTKMTNGKGETVEIEAGGVAERLSRELARDRRFYFQSSHGILNKQFEIMVIDEIVPENVGAWITPTDGRRLVNDVRRKRGLEPIDADHSLVCVHPLAGFDSAYTDDVGYVGGGGLTMYAYSGYATWNHGQGWLMGHEWGHQLDSYFDRSGMTDWWLNHPDGTVHVGRYGEHWDCNAFLCRRVDRMNWLRLRSGKLRLVADADEDGLADDDPALPLDEARFGSSPTSYDTDDDGLSDLDEALAGTFTRSDPTNPDSDGDGVTDGTDTHPQFAVADSIPQVSAAAAGMRPSLKRIGTLHGAWCDTEVRAGYDADALHFELRPRKAVRTIYLPIDFDNNGWFIGRDQVYPHVDLAWPADGPPTIGRQAGCEATLTVGDDGTVVVAVTVPRPATRAPLRSGSSVGVIIRAQNDGGRVQFLIDPWQVLGLELK